MKSIDATARLERLRACLEDCAPAALAVSGGVDSMTLAVVAARALGEQVTMFHAVSPAVPARATARVERYAAAEGWRLSIVTAGEFDDSRYRANPADRCYFCKTHLYASLARHTGAQLLSGTNLDDLGDWRPGLRAAADHDVRHPYVEAEIDKSGVRAIATLLGLDDLARLPGAPCLSSRVETGIAIEAEDLLFIDRAERLLQRVLRPRTVRCRVRREGIVVELDAAALTRLDPTRRHELGRRLRALGGKDAEAPVAFTTYKRGSAFLRSTAS